MTVENLLQVWSIGLSAWVIQDGNYADFVADQTAEFAIEFYQPLGVETAASSDVIAARHRHDCTYDVVADRMLQTTELEILNIGILVYSEGRWKFPLHRSANRIQTSLQLAVDPFFYFERLAKIAVVPPMIYSWHIDAILRQTAPLIKTPLDTGGTMLVRDETKLGYEEIPRTNAWTDDGGHAEYLLKCRLLDIPAKRESATAL